jgi:two-component system, NarL family, response regulator NreC
MGTLRILLADDHTVVRQGLRRVLEEHFDWHVVAEASDGRDAVRQAEEHKPDIAILDIAMPLLNGIEATRQIVRHVPTVRVLVLSMHADEAYITQVLHAGAAGYLLKDSADVDLLQAVSAVAAGKSFFSPAIARLMLDDFVKQRSGEHGVADRYESLSDREREVFQLVAEGKANKEIATLLGISPSTVETHRSRILEKLDLHSAVDVALYAVRRGIIR